MTASCACVCGPSLVRQQREVASGRGSDCGSGTCAGGKGVIWGQKYALGVLGLLDVLVVYPVTGVGGGKGGVSPR